MNAERKLNGKVSNLQMEMRMSQQSVRVCTIYCHDASTVISEEMPRCIPNPTPEWTPMNEIQRKSACSRSDIQAEYEVPKEEPVPLRPSVRKTDNDDVRTAHVK